MWLQNVLHCVLSRPHVYEVSVLLSVHQYLRHWGDDIRARLPYRFSSPCTPLRSPPSSPLLPIQPIVAKASATSVSELDAAIEQLRNNTRRCKSDVDALHRANEETGSVADDAAGKALATAAGTLGQAEQIMQQVRVRHSPTTSSASTPSLCFGTHGVGGGVHNCTQS